MPTLLEQQAILAQALDALRENNRMEMPIVPIRGGYGPRQPAQRVPAQPNEPEQPQRVKRLPEPSDIELNGQTFADDSTSSISPELREMYNRIVPDVNKGLVDERVLSGLLTKEIGADFETQQQQRKISREITALDKQYRAGRISDDALRNAVGAMHSEYGSSLISNPAFATLSGIENERKNAQEGAMGKFAEQEGIPRNRVRWDDRGNRPAFDANSAQIDFYKANLKEQEVDQAMKVETAKNRKYESKLKSITAQMVRLADIINSVREAGRDAPNEIAQYKKLDAEYLNLIKQDTGGSDIQQPAETGPSPLTGVTTAPIVDTTKFKVYETKAAALEGLNRGASDVGDTVMVEGTPYKVHPDGSIRRIQ